VDAMENEIIDANLNTITQLQNSTEMLIQGFDSLILPASLDFNLKHFAEQSQNLNYKDNQDIINTMVKVKSSSVYFDLCYVYYFENKKVLDLNRLNAQLRDANEIDNKRLLEEARELYFLDSNSGKPFIFSKIQMDKENNALVLVKPVYLLDENPSAIIVMTLKPSFFTDLMNKTSLNPKANVYIVDDSGKVIMSYNELHYFNEDNRQFSDNEKGYFR